MTTKLNVGVLMLAMSVCVFAAALFSLQSNVAKGSSYPGLPATIATTSNPTVTSTQSLVFASSTPSCTARIITTTAAGGINLTFTDYQGVIPSATVGHYQATSTTVAYDSGLYGCGAVRAYSLNTQNLTVSEAR